MSEQVVKRYGISGFGGGMIEQEDGAFYHMDDYDALHAEAEAWKSTAWERLKRVQVLHAEAEALRVALLEIASVNPAERGIEWAKSYASDGLKGSGSEPYARWLDAFKEAEALRAENAKLRTALAEQGERQEAVAWALANSADEIGGFAPIYYTKEDAISWANGRNIFPLYTTPQPGPDVRSLAASLYQACGAYDMPERILDALSAAASGEPFAHMIDGLLPCVPPSDQGVRALVESASAYLNALDSGAHDYDVKRARHSLRLDLAAHCQKQGGSNDT